MKLLDRYIAKTIFKAISLVTLMLIGMQLFILFVNQLDDIGKGDYGILQAASYIMMQMPYQVYLFFPLASLLGGLIGLGMMGQHRELIVMRAAGMSIAQVTWAVLKIAFLLIILVTLVGETIVPKLAQWGNDKRMQHLQGSKVLRTTYGIWLRNKNDFIAVNVIFQDNSLQDVYQFHFDSQHQLRFTRQIEKLIFQDSGWRAFNVLETRIGKTGTKTYHFPEMRWELPIKLDVLRVSSHELEEMTLSELKHYVRAQKQNHQNALNYQLAFLQRLLQPLTTLVMMMLAIPFVFGPLRSSTMGLKVLTGTAVGFAFHILNRFLGPLSQVLQWPVEITAIGPSCLFAFLGFYLMQRAK